MSRTGVVLLLVLCLGGCAAGAVSRADLAGEPTVFATVQEAPNPLLLGCRMRSTPTEYSRPNSYSYCLVRKDGGYAVFYAWRDGKTREEHRGWMPFTIRADRLVSGTDPSVFLVKDGEVWHNYAGRDTLHRMLRFGGAPPGEGATGRP